MAKQPLSCFRGLASMKNMETVKHRVTEHVIVNIEAVTAAYEICRNCLIMKQQQQQSLEQPVLKGIHRG